MLVAGLCESRGWRQGGVEGKGFMIIKRGNRVAAVVAVAGVVCLAGCGKEETVVVPPPKAVGGAAGEQSVDSLLGGPAAPVRSAAPPVLPTGAGAVVPGEAKVKVDPVLKAAIERYFENSGRAPEAWADLVKKQLIPAVPLDASGKPLDFRQFLLDMR